MPTIFSKLSGPFDWRGDIFTRCKALVGVTCLLYLPVVRSLPAPHPDRQGGGGVALRIWNLLFLVFNTVGTLKTLPELTRLTSVCDDSWLTTTAGRWVYYFNLSKLVELWDVLLLPTRAPAHHLYHHLLTLLYVFHSSVVVNHTGIWSATVNYLAHSLMYLHLTLKGAGYRSPLRAGVIVSQLVEMVIGFVVQLMTLRCGSHSRTNTWLALFMYASYFLMFAWHSRSWWARAQVAGEREESHASQASRDE